MNRILFLAAWLVLGYAPVLGQSLEEKAIAVQQANAQLNQQQSANNSALETIKFEMIHRDLETVGLPSMLPGSKVVWHSAWCLEYSEQHEQARWVAHIITSDITTGVVSRTNDFRPDPDISTGSAVEADYLLKYLQKDSTYKYDGFGYDRGHLAPSADFRWSQKALSESYLYSNMPPATWSPFIRKTCPKALLTRSRPKDSQEVVKNLPSAAPWSVPASVAPEISC